MDSDNCGLRVAVIGAGASGLTAIKSCLDEGITPVCFERTSDLGGLWHYTDKPCEGQACVARNTSINSSKEMSSFSDFPVDADFPNYMHHSYVLRYFEKYAAHFDLEKHIRYRTSVKMVSRADDFSETGRWKIDSRNEETGEEKSEIFDGVLVCSGHHADKYQPDFPGLKDFGGKVFHTHDYRKPDGMEDKRVLIVGIGNSAGDLAVDLSNVAKQIFLSTRRGTWMFSRMGPKGYPVDMMFITRGLRILLNNLIPDSIVDAQFKNILNQRFNHDLYSLTPDFGPLEQHPMVNDDLPNRIMSGKVKVKTDIKQFTKNGVEFTDGTKEDNIDVVALATGYSFGFPFIDKTLINVQENRCDLYKNMYLPDLEHNTLAFIGCAQPIGSIMPISEIQCRLATRVIKKVQQLPSCVQMWEDIRFKQANMAKRYVKSRRHTIQVDYDLYMDEIAELLGCRPHIWSLLRHDPALAFKVYLGPVTSYQFRLQGPGQWSGAREAIMRQWERVETPLKSRVVPKQTKGSKNWWMFIAAVLIVLLARYLFLS